MASFENFLPESVSQSFCKTKGCSFKVWKIFTFNIFPNPLVDTVLSLQSYSGIGISPQLRDTLLDFTVQTFTSLKNADNCIVIMTFCLRNNSSQHSKQAKVVRWLPLDSVSIITSLYDWTHFFSISAPFFYLKA